MSGAIVPPLLRRILITRGDGLSPCRIHAAGRTLEPVISSLRAAMVVGTAGALLLAGLPVSVAERESTVWYVAGNPAPDPPSDLPDRCAAPDVTTPQAAVDQAVTGDVIYLCPGTYELIQTLTLRPPDDGATPPSLTITGYSAAASVITADADPGATPVQLIDARGWDLSLEKLSLIGGSATEGPGAVGNESRPLGRRRHDEPRRRRGRGCSDRGCPAIDVRGERLQRRRRCHQRHHRHGCGLHLHQEQGERRRRGCRRLEHHGVPLRVLRQRGLNARWGDPRTSWDRSPDARCHWLGLHEQPVGQGWRDHRVRRRELCHRRRRREHLHGERGAAGRRLHVRRR